jgi:N-acetylneuraminic acid mutarotase
MVNNPTKGRRAYLVGGRGNRDTDIYNPVTRLWSKGANPSIKIHHMQCVAAQGKLWIMAAWKGNFPKETNANAIVYNPAADSWETMTPLEASRRRGGAAVVVSDDETKIYVSHGNIARDGKSRCFARLPRRLRHCD